MTAKAKTAIISGGAGIIGFSVLKKLCSLGMNAAIFSSTQEKAVSTKKRLGELGENCLALGCDVADINSIQECVKKTYDTFGGIDVVISMQGCPPKCDEIEDITDEYWNETVSSHLTGTFNMVKYTVPYLKNSTMPRIVFLTSNSMRFGDLSEGLPYVTVKGGIESMMIYASKSLSKYGITVNCVAAEGMNNTYAVDDKGNVIQNEPIDIDSMPEKAASAVCRLLSDDKDTRALSGMIIDLGKRSR